MQKCGLGPVWRPSRKKKRGDFRALIIDATIAGDRRRSAESSFGVWVTSCRSPHPNAHRKLRPLHCFTYYATTTRPNETLLSGNIPGPVRKVLPKERCNLGRFGVVVGDGLSRTQPSGFVFCVPAHPSAATTKQLIFRLVENPPQKTEKFKPLQHLSASGNKASKRRHL
jgi:hypothetical protein